MSFYFPSGNSGWLLYLQCSCVATIQIALVTDELTKYVTMNCRTLKSLTLQTYSLLIVDHLHVYIDLVNLLEGCIKLWSPVALHWQEGKMSNLSQLFFYTVKLLNNGHPFCKASVTSIEGFQCIFYFSSLHKNKISDLCWPRKCMFLQFLFFRYLSLLWEALVLTLVLATAQNQ